MKFQKDTITFEYPLNETIRICMRMEYLFNQLNENLSETGPATYKPALVNLLQILDFIDRPDLKSKLAQMLSQQAISLGQLKHSSQVDAAQLSTTLQQLEKLIENLHLNRKKIGESLRNNEFLNQIRMQLNNPGGICPTKSPAYLVWQKRSPESCSKDLHIWTKELDDVQDIIYWILKITRESATTQDISAVQGFYSQSLDPNSGQIVRITLPDSLNIFPEVSIGKHHLTIRFLTPNFHDNGRATQTRDTILFQLSCCKM